MDQRLIAAIRNNLDAKPTDELRRAYEAQDFDAWSPEAFIAMRQLLTERGETDISPLATVQTEMHQTPGKAAAQELALLAVVVAGAATLWGAFIVASGNYCWNAFAFTMMTSGLSAGVLFLAVLPSWLRYSKTSQPEDRTALRMAGISFLLLVAEAIALQVMPQGRE